MDQKVIIILVSVAVLGIFLYLYKWKKQKEGKIIDELDHMIAHGDIEGIKAVYRKQLYVWSALLVAGIGLLVYCIMTGTRIIHYIIFNAFCLYRVFVPVRELYQLSKISPEDLTAKEPQTEEPESQSVTITLPEEEFVEMEAKMQDNGMPFLTLLNTSIVDFEYKEYFNWKCVVWVDYDKDEETGLPTDEGLEMLNNFTDQLDELLKDAEEKQNALFLLRFIGNGQAECVWMLNDPGKGNETLESLNKSGNYVHAFQYSIERDDDWSSYNYILDSYREYRASEESNS